ncbi:hypothetical protein L9F63_024321, partial [Diploptera punctata]
IYVEYFRHRNWLLVYCLVYVFLYRCFGLSLDCTISIVIEEDNRYMVRFDTKEEKDGVNTATRELILLDRRMFVFYQFFYSLLYGYSVEIICRISVFFHVHIT